MSRVATKEAAAAAAVLIAATVSLLICGGLLFYGAGRGFDLTDETFYLLWTRDPHAYRLMYQPFGYLLHPLFELMHENLRAYRLSGFAVAVGAGALLGWSIARARQARAATAIYGAAAALTIFFPWIITPSYNSAADVGAMLIIAGIVDSGRGGKWSEVRDVVAIAAGLCIAAFSKPPLFVIATMVVLGAALCRRQVRALIAAAAALVCAAGLIFLFIAPAQVPAVVKGIIASQHVLGLPNTVEKLPLKIARDCLIVPIPLIGAAICSLTAFGLFRSRWLTWPAVAGIVLSLYYLASVTEDAVEDGIPDFFGLALVTLAASYAALVHRRGGVPRRAILLLLCAPFTVALGTFNNQWFQFNFSLAFAFIAIFVIATCDPARLRSGLATAFATTAPIAAMLMAAWHPYSLPASIFEQQTAVAVPLARGTVRVDDETAAFITAARGMAAGRPLIDLSGTGPGVAAALGARSPVLPWLNPATPTWPDVVWSRLNDADRRNVLFVTPVWPLFVKTAPARWFAAHAAAYCRADLPEMPFWGEERTLQLWQPCGREKNVSGRKMHSDGETS